jgi:hypothetical protein
MLNFCGIVAAILKMAIDRNFSMSGINLGHYYLPIISNFDDIGKCWIFTAHNLCRVLAAIVKMADIAPLMVTYHYVKFYVSIIIDLEVININVRNFNFPIGFYSNPHPLWSPQNMTLTPFTTKLDQLESYIYNSTKFHENLSSSSWDLPWTSSWSSERKEKKENNNNNNKKIIIRRNGAKK